MRKETLRSLSLSYQKKDGRAWPRTSFFWYDTDFSEFDCADIIDYILEKLVSYQKKDGHGHAHPFFFWYDKDSGHWGPFCVTEPILLLGFIWQKLLVKCVFVVTWSWPWNVNEACHVQWYLIMLCWAVFVTKRQCIETLIQIRPAILIFDIHLHSEYIKSTQCIYRKFSNKGASPNKGAPLFSGGYPDSKFCVFGHISAKNGPIFIP